MALQRKSKQSYKEIIEIEKHNIGEPSFFIPRLSSGLISEKNAIE